MTFTFLGLSSYTALEAGKDEALPLIQAAFGDLKDYDHGVRAPRKLLNEKGMVWNGSVSESLCRYFTTQQ